MTSSELYHYRYWHGNGPRLFASKRLKEETFFPQFKSPFSIKKSDSIFAIGSCFARALEPVIRKHGHDDIDQSAKINILPSSDSSYINLSEKCRQLFKNCELITFYDGAPRRPYPKN